MKSFFISSTFKDMQTERDILHERVFPRLRRLIKEYGDEVQEVDLRWGVDTVNMSEEESGHEVLKICIDAIDRCKPYIIVLLGERYGWIPGRDIVDSVNDTRISDRYEAEMSITELEIQYGALLRDENFDRCVFCFRDPEVNDKIDADERYKYDAESPHHAKRLTALKNQIRAREGAIIMDYTADWDSTEKCISSLDGFEAQIYEILEKMIKRDFEGKRQKSAKEKQSEEIDLIKSEYLSSYVRRYPEEFKIIKSISNYEREYHGYSKGDCECIVLRGGAGSGKSALMAFTAHKVSEGNMPVILTFAAASGCRTPSLLKSYIIYRLELLLRENHDAEMSADERLRVLNKKLDNKKVVCFVDAVDQIYGMSENVYIDLPALCPNIFWVFSALSDFPVENALGFYTYDVIEVGSLFREQIEDIIFRTAGKRGKKLDGEVTSMITHRQGSSNPLFISLVLQRFFMMNKKEFESAEAIAPGMDGLHRYMQGLLEEMPDLPDRMAAYILDVTAKMFDQKQFNEVLMLIAMSKGGLSENELTDILRLENIEFSQLGFQQTVSYLYDAFSQRSNGKWTFVHRLFGEAVQGTMSDDDRERICSLLVQYSLDDDTFMQNEGFYYMLDAKSEHFARLFGAFAKWESLEDVFHTVRRLASDSEEYREFFTDITRKYPSDEAADFWLSAEVFLYGDEAEKMSVELDRILLDSDAVSPRVKWRLALDMVYYAPKGEMLALLERAENYSNSLSEPEFSIARSGIYSELARVLSALDEPYEKIQKAREDAVSYIEKAIAELGESDDWRSYRELFKYLRIICANASSWDSPDSLDLWLKGLSLLDSLERFADNSAYKYRRGVFLTNISKNYCKKEFRDYTKAKEYGDMALSITEELASAEPTVYNLELKKSAVYAYIERLKEEYRHPYLKEAVDASRRVYTALKDDYSKKELAYAEARYASSMALAINTVNDNFKHVMISETDEIWDHSFALYEELISQDKCDMNEKGSYATYLISRAEIYRFRGYYEKAMTYAERSIELLEAYKSWSFERYQKARTEEMKRYEYHGVNWSMGWLARAKGVIADIYISRLECDRAELFAKEAYELSFERSSTIASHYKRAMDSLVILAKAKYYQRKDSEALEVCDTLAGLVSDPKAEHFETELIKGEAAYIRARIALLGGDTKSAWEYCLECEKYSVKDSLYRDKLAVLKADCLSSLGDSTANGAWLDALKLWRNRFDVEKGIFEKNVHFNIYVSYGRVTKLICTREDKRYAIAAYYMAYCFYNYASEFRDESQLDETATFNGSNKDILEILNLLDLGTLNTIRPEWFKLGLQYESVERACALPRADSASAFVDTLVSLTSPKVNPCVYDFILSNSDVIESAVPTAEQFAVLSDSAKLIDNELFSERVDFKQALERAVLHRQAFSSDSIPVFWRNFTHYTIWSDDDIQKRILLWRAYFRLLLFTARCRDTDENGKKRVLDMLLFAFRGIADIENDGKGVEGADFASITDKELISLIDIFSMENELRNKGGFRYWYESKNCWVTEMYERTGDRSHLDRRLCEFNEFLTDKYEQIYQGYDVSDKKNMVFEVSQAAMHFIRTLAENGFDAEALEVARWFEGTPSLRGRMMSRTLELLSGGGEWLEKIKLSYYAKWLDTDDLRTLRVQ